MFDGLLAGLDALPAWQATAAVLAVSFGSAVLLSLWEYDVSPLLAGAGIAGIAVGFAAKDTVANFFGVVERSSTASRTSSDDGIALYFDARTNWATSSSSTPASREPW